MIIQFQFDRAFSFSHIAANSVSNIELISLPVAKELSDELYPKKKRSDYLLPHSPADVEANEQMRLVSFLIGIDL